MLGTAHPYRTEESQVKKGAKQGCAEHSLACVDRDAQPSEHPIAAQQKNYKLLLPLVSRAPQKGGDHMCNKQTDRQTHPYKSNTVDPAFALLGQPEKPPQPGQHHNLQLCLLPGFTGSPKPAQRCANSTVLSWWEQPESVLMRLQQRMQSAKNTMGSSCCRGQEIQDGTAALLEQGSIRGKQHKTPIATATAAQPLPLGSSCCRCPWPPMKLSLELCYCCCCYCCCCYWQTCCCQQGCKARHWACCKIAGAAACGAQSRSYKLCSGINDHRALTAQAQRRWC